MKIVVPLLSTCIMLSPDNIFGVLLEAGGLFVRRQLGVGVPSKEGLYRVITM